MTNERNLTTKQLLRLISPNSNIREELVNRGVIRSGNIVGDIGEFHCEEFFKKKSSLPNLIRSPPGVQNVDMISRKGERYSVKTVTNRRGTTGSFWNPESIKNNEKNFEYLIIVVLDRSYDLDLLLRLSWEDFFNFKSFNVRMNNFNIRLTNILINSVETIYKKID